MSEIHTRSTSSPAQPGLFFAEGSAAATGRGSRQALCLWLPTFELRLELVRAPQLDSTSVALLSSEGGVRRTVEQVSERAYRAGVRPGQLVGQAVSLCPSLTLLEPDPAHYDAAQEAMLEVLAELTPIVEPAGRGRVYLGMDGLERLYGPPPHQLRRALDTLLRVLPAPLVVSLRAGYAPGKFGAWVAAVRAGAGRPVVVAEEDLSSFLARCPVSSLPVDETMVQRLERLGVSTLEALSRLPEAALVAQFGEEGRAALAWASGRRVDPVRPWHCPRPIRISLEFPTPVGQTAPLHGAIDRLLERALSAPARRGRSVVALRLGACLEGGGSWVVEQVLREPSARRESIAFALRARLALSPPTRAVEALVLELTRFGAPSAQAELFGRGEVGGRAEEGRDLAGGELSPALRDALKELKLRLGHAPLYRVVEVDPWSRIPERRHALLSFDP